MNQNNSAHRLCAILEKAVSIKGEEKDTTVAIGKAMGITNISEKHFMTDFFVLISDVESSILKLKNISRQTEYLNTIRTIQNLFFSHNLCNDHWPNIRNTINSGNLILLLDACANFIAMEFSVKNLSEKELADCLTKCEELLREITESELTTDLKTFLVVRFEEICTAIRHYSIGGSERLQTVVEASIGAIILRSVGISQQDKVKLILNTSFTWLLTFGALLGMVTDTQALLQSPLANQIFLPPSK